MRLFRALTYIGRPVASRRAIKRRALRVESLEDRRLLSVVPNDPLFPLQWDLQNTGQTINGVTGTPHADINVVPAWSHGTGTGQTVVAVIDTGVEYDHPDITPNLWTNPGEIPNNANDDDNSGVTDDIHGATPFYGIIRATNQQQGGPGAAGYTE